MRANLPQQLALCLICGLGIGAPSLLAAETPAKTTDFYPVGARVEVKKNNQWLPATVVKRDGGKAFIKFDGATDAFNEWIEASQVREASVVTGTVPPPAATKPAAKAPSDPFAVGAEIEALWHDRWTDTIVISRNGENAEVLFSDAFKETVGPTQMRVRGVTQEAAAKLTSQSGLFATGAKVEIKWGQSWYDGTILSRNASEAQVKTSDGFTHRVASAEIRTRAVATPAPAAPAVPAAPVASSGATPPLAPVAGVKPGVTPNVAAGADAFVAGALIEYPFGESNWFDGVVKGREGPLVKIADKNGFERSIAPTELRFRGILAAQLTPEKQVEYLKPGTKVETTNGSWWSDGVVERRDARRVMVKSGAWSNWHDLTEVRTRAVTTAAAVTGSSGGATTGPAALPPSPLAANWTAARRIELDQAPPAGWIAAPDPTTQPARPAIPRPQGDAGKPQTIPLPPMASVAGTQNALWQYVEVLIVPSGSSTGMVVHVQDGHGDIPYIAQIERVDLNTGSITSPIGMPEGLLPIDMSADGRRILLEAHGARKHSVVEVWSIEAKPGQPMPAKNKEIQPFANAEDVDDTISAAAFIDGDHLLFAGGKDDLVMVDLQQMKVIWATKTNVPLSRIALSPGHQQVAVPTALGVFLLDPMTGNAVGLLGGGGTSTPHSRRPIPNSRAAMSLFGAADMRFSPDGKKLIGVDQSNVNVWDISTGELWRAFSVTGGSNPQWVDENHVMLGGTRLVDLDRRVVVWTYQYPGLQNLHPVSAAGGGKFWYLVSEPPKPNAKAIHRQLAGITLPPQSLAASMAAVKPEELYSWYPGQSVSLSVSVSAEPEKATAALKQAIADRGLKVVDGSPVRVEVSTSTGESKSTTYQKRTFGAGGPPTFTTETVTITPTISRVAIIDASGKTLWQSSATSGGYAPGMISLKEGQTAQDVMNEYSKPNLGFFQNIKLPDYITLPREKEGFGQSALTGNGIELVKTPAP